MNRCIYIYTYDNNNCIIYYHIKHYIVIYIYIHTYQCVYIYIEYLTNVKDKTGEVDLPILILPYQHFSYEQSEDCNYIVCNYIWYIIR